MTIGGKAYWCFDATPEDGWAMYVEGREWLEPVYTATGGEEDWDVRVDRPGVYVHLFHGRTDPAQNMEDWGSDGPILGPFQYVHITYKGDVKLGGEPDDTVTPWPVLQYADDMIYYDGVYYGDWAMTCWPPLAPEFFPDRKIEAWARAKSVPPAAAASQPALPPADESATAPADSEIAALQKAIDAVLATCVNDNDYARDVAESLGVISGRFHRESHSIETNSYGGDGRYLLLKSIADAIDTIAAKVEEDGTA